MDSYTASWKDGNYNFVAAAFDYAYANRLKRIFPIMGQKKLDQACYALVEKNGVSANLNHGNKDVDGENGFPTIITPEEFSLSESVGYKQAKIDKSGECSRVGKMLGNSAAMTVYMHALRMFANAFDKNHVGGDGKPWAAYNHPFGNRGGVYSNLLKEPLSNKAVWDAIEMAMHIPIPNGYPLDKKMTLLLVSPELEYKAKEICAENGVGVQKLRYMVIGLGTDGFAANQWAICDPDMMQKTVSLCYMTKPTLFQTAVSNPAKDLYTAYVDFGCGWGDARQIIFSNPYWMEVV